MRRYNQGWRQESERHSLASRGVKTGKKKSLHFLGLALLGGAGYVGYKVGQKKKKHLHAEGKEFDLERKSQIGKFDDNVAERIYQDSLDGTGEQLGDVQDFGWYGRVSYGDEEPLEVKERDGEVSHVVTAIIHEDNDGNVDVHEYQAFEDADREWKNIEKDYRKFMKAQEKEEHIWRN